MSTIQIVAEHASGVAARSNVRYVIESPMHDGYFEIDPSTALTVASWWQSSGSIGSKLAAFASGCEVDRDELLEDIYHTRRDVGRPIDRDALDCLSTFVINYSADRTTV